MYRFISFIGLIFMMFLAWLISENKKSMNWRLILTGVGLQFIFAVLILWTKPGMMVFSAARFVVAQIIGFSDA